MLFWLVSVISLFLVSFYPTLFLTLTAVYDADRTWWLLGSIFILIFSPPVISYLASSEQLPGPCRQEPCQARHWECRSSYSRSGASQWPAENIIIVTVSILVWNIPAILPTYFMMCRNVSIASRQNALTNHQSFCSFYFYRQYITFLSAMNYHYHHFKIFYQWHYYNIFLFLTLYNTKETRN